MYICVVWVCFKFICLSQCMFVCACVHISVCKCMCVYEYMPTYMHLYVCLYVQYVCLYVCVVCACACTCVHVRICACGCMHVSVHVCAGACMVGLRVTTSCLLFSVKTLDHEVHLPRQTGTPDSALLGIKLVSQIRLHMLHSKGVRGEGWGYTIIQMCIHKAIKHAHPYAWAWSHPHMRPNSHTA